MANVEVSTWAELLTAIAGFTNGDTIKLMADIDLTEDYSMGVDKITLAADKTFIIDGSFHTIKGLSNNLTTPDSLFEAAGATTGFILRNIDFYNCNLANGDFYKNTDASAQTVEFNRVRFLGRRTGTSYLINAQHILLERCYIEMPWQGLNESNLAYTSLAPRPVNDNTTTDYVANFCHFAEHYTGWVVGTSATQSSRNYLTFSCSFFKISGCRVSGDMTVRTYNGTRTFIDGVVLYLKNAQSYSPFAMNVLDVEITGIAAITRVQYGNWFGLYISKVKNSDGDPATEWANAIGVSNDYAIPLFASESQAESAEWLHNNGFDIAYE